VKVIQFKQGEPIINILGFMFDSVEKDKEACVASMNGVMVTMAPDQKKSLIQVPGMMIKDPAHS
jgi:hypothetical protein